MKSAPKVILTVAITFMAWLLTFAMPTEQPIEIHVRIMDSRTHQPLKQRKVQISFSGMDGRWYDKGLTMTGNSGSDGVTVFVVKQPVPPRMNVVDLDAYPCSRPEDFPTQEVLANGVVARWTSSGIQKADKWCTADPIAGQPQKRPGEVVFFVHPLNVWQNFWYTLLK